MALRFARQETNQEVAQWAQVRRAFQMIYLLLLGRTMRKLIRLFRRVAMAISRLNDDSDSLPKSIHQRRPSPLSCPDIVGMR